MLGSSHLISGVDIATGTFALMVFSAGAGLVVLVVLAMMLFRRAGQGGMSSAFWGGSLVLVGAMLAYMIFDRAQSRDQATDRRAIEARTAELTALSIAPGSALACLDAVASVVIENACEKSLFATPEAVAAAVSYVDARFSLLAPSVMLAERDPAYRPSLERLRHALEADRFGLVAHVLTTRGCNGADCAELRLLRDPARVVANMKARAFEASLGAHALAWQPSGSGTAALASAPSSSFPAPPPLTTTTGVAPGIAAASNGAAPPPSRFDFPSASSIPSVSIMSAEPSAPPDAEPPPRTSALPPKRPAAAPAPPAPAAAPAPPVRRHTAREVAPPLPPPAPPTQIAPEPAPPAPAPPAIPDPHSVR